MEILSAEDWYYDQLRRQSGKTMSHFELAENYSKYILEKQNKKMHSEAIDLFITEIKTEFKDDNWDYLEFIKERVV